MLRSRVLGAMACLAAVVSAQSSVLLVDQGGSNPAWTSPLFAAVGTFNNPAGVARLEAAGQTVQQGVVPSGSGWWAGGVTRAFELVWNNVTGTVDFRLYAAADWAGPAAIQLMQTPAMVPGNALVGVQFGLSLASTTFTTSASFAYSDVQVLDVGGYVPVTTAGGPYTVTGSFLTGRFHGAYLGALGEFRLRGKATFTGSVNTATDFCRFTIEGRQGPAARRTVRTGATATGATFAVHHALPPGTLGNVAGFLWSPPFAGTLPLAVPGFAVDGVLRVDPAAFVVLGVTVTDGVRLPSMALAVPPAPALVGTQLDCQSFDIAPTYTIYLSTNEAVVTITSS